MKTLERSRHSKNWASLDERLKKIRESLAYAQDGLKVDLAEEVWVGMKAKGLSQAGLARKIGKSRAYVSKILDGTTNFTVDTAAAILWALDRKLEIRVVEKK